MSNDHEKLVEEVDKIILSGHAYSARAILAHVAKRLSDVTPEMVEAWAFASPGLLIAPKAESDDIVNRLHAECDWRAMLAASPLTPGER